MPANTSNGPDAGSATVGIGGATSGQAGATPTRETQQETGGSGGAQLTHSTGEISDGANPAPATAADEGADPVDASAEADTSAMMSHARGALDTTAQQAGGTGTGLGARETGANQSEKDLPPGR
jgi:hypothetical protein